MCFIVYVHGWFSIAGYLAIFYPRCVEWVMRLFCLLWIPLFYFFRRSVSSCTGGRYILTLLLGCAALVFQFFPGPLVTPGGFGLSRWLSGFIDVTAMPVILPLLVCLLFILLKIFPANTDAAGFALLWLIPLAAFHSISWRSQGSLISLVFVPALWTAQAVGIPFFTGFITRNPRWYITASTVLGIAALPLAATASWWAFFCQRTLLGALLLCLSFVPAVISLVLDFIKMKKNESA